MARKFQSGQALVLVLLSLSVVLTLVLFILSRSITDISVSSTQEESIRAFSEAEAGIERSLIVGTGFSSTDIGNASYTTSVTDFALGGYDISYPSPLIVGEVATTWFTSHDTDGNLTCSALPCFTGDRMKVCWGNPGTGNSSATTPAIEISVFYESPVGSIANVRVARALIDPNSARRGGNANILAHDAGTCTIGAQTYQFQKTLTFSSLGIPSSTYQNNGGLQLSKIKMLYNSDQPHLLGVSVNSSGDTLPSQGQQIDSRGVAGDSNRRIVVYQSYAENPFFGSSIVTPAGITK